MEDFQLAPPDDPLYVVRKADAEFERALREGIRLIRLTGSARTGKSSLLARSCKSLRGRGHRVVWLDFAAATVAEQASLDLACRWIAGQMVSQLSLADPISDQANPGLPRWNEARSSRSNLERFVPRHAIPETDASLILFWDACERLDPAATLPSIARMVREWYNEAAFGVEPWSRLVSTVARSADRSVAEWVIKQHEHHTDEGFYVGTGIHVADFIQAQVAEMNHRAGSVLPDTDALDRFHRLVGGQPLLVRRGLEHLRSRGGGVARLEAAADGADSPWADFLGWLGQECDAVPRVRQVVHDLAGGRTPADAAACFGAHSLGLLNDNHDAPGLRCDLYRRYFARRYGA